MHPESRYWKFLKFNDFSLDIIKKGEIHFSKPEVLNDALEGVLDRDKLLDSLVKHIKENKQKFQNDFGEGWPEVEKGLEVYDEGILLDRFAVLYKECIDAAYFCFTRSCRNDVMWAAYADESKGFALGFKSFRYTEFMISQSINLAKLIKMEIDSQAWEANAYKMFKSNNEDSAAEKPHSLSDTQKEFIKSVDLSYLYQTTPLVRLYDVTYHNDWEKLQNNFVEILAKFMIISHKIEGVNSDKNYDLLAHVCACISIKLCLLKKGSWEYEEESRILLPLGPVHQNIIKQNQKFAKSELIAIIFGEQTSDKNINETIDLLEENDFKHVKAYKAVRNSNYDLEFEALKK